MKTYQDFIIEENEGILIGVHYSGRTDTLLKEYIHSRGYPPTHQMHSTLIYSRDPLHGFVAQGLIFDQRVNPIKFSVLNNALVIEVKSPWMSNRHNEIRRKYDAPHDFDRYIPHITIAYDFDGDIRQFNISDLSNIDFTIADEYSEPLNAKDD